MSGFLSHLAARGMGQAGAVHSAARLPYASAPALVEDRRGGHGAAALWPSSLSPSGPAHETCSRARCRRGRMRRPMGRDDAVPTPPAPLLRRPLDPVAGTGRMPPRGMIATPREAPGRPMRVDRFGARRTPR